MLERLRLLAVLLLLAVPGSARAQELEQANDLLARQRWGKAVSSFRWITREEPTNGQAWLGLAEALRGKGDLPGALEAAAQAAERPRVAPQALYLRGCLLAEQGSREEALAALEGAVRIGFNDATRMAAEPALEALRTDPAFRLPQGHEERSATLAGGGFLQYLLAVPKGFRASRTYPVLVALGPGAQTLEAARFLLTYFVGEQAVQAGWVAAAPEAPQGGWTGASGIDAFESFLDELERQVRPEGGRFHLVGSGNGAYSGFVLAQLAAERVHSLTAMAGAPQPGPGLDRLASIRVLQFVGEMDGTWIASVEQMHVALEGAGVRAELEVIPGERHFLGALAGDTLMQRIERLRQP